MAWGTPWGLLVLEQEPPQPGLAAGARLSTGWGQGLVHPLHGCSHHVTKFVTLNQRGKRDAMIGHCPGCSLRLWSLLVTPAYVPPTVTGTWFVLWGAQWEHLLGLKATFSGHCQAEGLVSPAQGYRGPGRSHGHPDHTRPWAGPGHREGTARGEWQCCRGRALSSLVKSLWVGVGGGAGGRADVQGESWTVVGPEGGQGRGRGQGRGPSSA